MKSKNFRYFEIQLFLRAKNHKVDKLASSTSRQEGYSLPKETIVRTVEILMMGAEAFEVK